MNDQRARFRRRLATGAAIYLFGGGAALIALTLLPFVELERLPEALAIHSGASAIAGTMIGFFFRRESDAEPPA